MYYTGNYVYSTWPRHATGWSQPPHPIDVIPSFDPSASAQQKARLVLWDYFHDDDLRHWADRDEVKKAFGVKKKEDYDTGALVSAYENPQSPVWRRGASWNDLSAAVQKAIARRTVLGPLPIQAAYDTDPVVIPYYDNDRIKKIVYPRSAISAESGYALDAGNIYWWKNHDIHTFEWHNGQWGDEGFDWDKDVAGNVGTITGTIMAVVGAVLQVIPGVGTGVGAALIALAPVVGSLLGAADTAFQGGDMGTAIGNIGQSILQLANKELGSEAGFKMDDATAKKLGQNLGLLAADAAGLQKQGLSFSAAWNKLAASGAKYGVISDDVAKTIMAALGSDAAAKVFRAGYDAAQYADSGTLGAVSNLFADAGARSVFQFGAGIGLLKKSQAKPATMTKGMSNMYFTGQLSPAAQAAASNVPTVTAPAASVATPSSSSSSDDFGSQLGSTLLNVFGNAANALAQQGIAKLAQAGIDPRVTLANQIAILGPKYGVSISPLKVMGLIPGSVVSGNVSVGQNLVERYRAGKTSLNPSLANRATYGSDTITGQCVLSDGTILPLAGWNEDGTYYCIDPKTGEKLDSTGHATQGWGPAPWDAPFGDVYAGQCIDPHDGFIVPMYDWDQFGNVVCIDPHDGKKIDAQGHVVGAMGHYVGQCVMPDGSILPIAGWDEAGNVYCMTPKGQKVDATGHVITGFQSSGPMFDWRFYQG